MSSVSQQSLFAPSHAIMHIPLPPPRPVPTNTDLTRLCWQQDGTPHEEFGFDRTNLARLLHIHSAKTSRCSFTVLHHLWIFGCFAVRLIVVLMNQGRFMAHHTSPAREPGSLRTCLLLEKDRGISPELLSKGGSKPGDFQGHSLRAHSRGHKAVIVLTFSSLQAASGIKGCHCPAYF